MSYRTFGNEVVDYKFECMQEELESSSKSKDDTYEKNLLKNLDTKNSKEKNSGKERKDNSGVETGVNSRQESRRNSKINLKKMKTVDIPEAPETANKPEEMPSIRTKSIKRSVRVDLDPQT